MAVYNEENYIAEAIRSVRNQTYQNLQMIIVDDLSTDRSMEIAHLEAEDDPRIIVIEEGLKLGKINAFNTAYEHADGRFVTLLGGDDYLPLESLANRIKPLLDTPKGSASVARLKMVSEIPKFDGRIVPKVGKRGTFSGGTILFEHELAERIFPIPETLGNEDIWCVEHIKCFAENIEHIPEISYYYRIHELNSVPHTLSFSDRSRQTQRRNEGRSLFLHRYSDVLSDMQKETLQRYLRAEELRRSSALMRLLFLRGFPLKERLRYTAFSNPLLYWIWKILYRFLSGW